MTEKTEPGIHKGEKTDYDLDVDELRKDLVNDSYGAFFSGGLWHAIQFPHVLQRISFCLPLHLL